MCVNHYQTSHGTGSCSCGYQHLLSCFTDKLGPPPPTPSPQKKLFTNSAEGFEVIDGSSQLSAVSKARVFLSANELSCWAWPTPTRTLWLQDVGLFKSSESAHTINTKHLLLFDLGWLLGSETSRKPMASWMKPAAS